MSTPHVSPHSLDAAAQAQAVVMDQFAQAATLIREIARIEALMQQEGVSDILKEILHQEAQAAYARLKTIREWTDGEIGRVLSTTTAPPEGRVVETDERVDFGTLIPREWELIPLAARLAIQAGTARLEQIADAKEKVRAFRRKVATFGKPYAALTEKERMRLVFMQDPKH